MSDIQTPIGEAIGNHRDFPCLVFYAQGELIGSFSAISISFPIDGDEHQVPDGRPGAQLVHRAVDNFALILRQRRLCPVCQQLLLDWPAVLLPDGRALLTIDSIAPGGQHLNG